MGIKEIFNEVSKLSYANLLKQANVSYIGATKHSAKMEYSYENGTETYCIYLAPANMSGYNVCPNSKYCKDFCLNGSGKNKVDILAHGVEHSKINLSRIKKTVLFHKQKDLFMQIVIKEIIKYMNHAKKNGLNFAIRLNGTSDLSPEAFVYKGKNILELFPNIQFYDYTKVASRLNISNKYPNYDLTLSFNGYNWNTCKKYLDNGGKVAMVFGKDLPEDYKTYNVIDANGYDMRYLDPKGTIMGLHYHATASDFVKGHYVMPTTKFIVTDY